MGKMEISVNLGENEYDPQDFVEATILSEKLGFRTVWFGDHLVPWYHSGKRSSFAWSVMGVALEKTRRVKVGPWVTVPIGARYHPAIIAQAAATLDNMYPGRFQLGVGTGEAFNEIPIWNNKWPNWEERMERLTEGTKLIRQMWESKEPFKFEGKYFSSDFYFLYTKPQRAIPIYSSAIGRKAAYGAGVNAEGLITISPRNDPKRLKEVILPEYKRGRNDANKEGLGKVAVELVFSFDKPDDLLRNAWRTLGICAKDSWSVSTPVGVEEAGKNVTLEDLHRNMHFCKNWKDVVNVIEEYRKVGVNEVTTYTGCNKKLIRAFAKNVLSAF